MIDFIRKAVHIRRRKNRCRSHGFTLVEINLAIFIMAVGVLALVGLYPLGYRENSQSRDDVASAALADAVLNPLVAVMSSTNITWSAWSAIGTAAADGSVVLPATGWRGYFSDDGLSRPESGFNSIAQGVFDSIIRGAAIPGSPNFPTIPKGVSVALVVRREGARISMSFRATRRTIAILSQPLYYTEVRFQGDPNR